MNVLFCHAADGAFVGGCVLRGVVACGSVVDIVRFYPCVIGSRTAFIKMAKLFCRRHAR